MLTGDMQSVNIIQWRRRVTLVYKMGGTNLEGERGAVWSRDKREENGGGNIPSHLILVSGGVS